jgi:hypothetical protein
LSGGNQQIREHHRSLPKIQQIRPQVPWLKLKMSCVLDASLV